MTLTVSGMGGLFTNKWYLKTKLWMKNFNFIYFLRKLWRFLFVAVNELAGHVWFCLFCNCFAFLKGRRICSVILRKPLSPSITRGSFSHFPLIQRFKIRRKSWSTSFQVKLSSYQCWARQTQYKPYGFLHLTLL